MTCNIKLRQTLELEIASLNANGQGEAFYEGKTIDVENVFPGDKVKASVTFISKEKIFAKAFEFIQLSPLRIKPFCPLALQCGGCNWQEIAYENQLVLKQKMIEGEFKKQQLNLQIHSVCPSPYQAYRSKIQLPLSYTKGKVLLGYFKKNSHEIIDLASCPVHPNSVNSLTEKLKDLIIKKKISIYEEKKHKGLLRHVLLRFSVWEQKSVLTLVLNSSDVPSVISQLAEQLVTLDKTIKAIVVNFNTQEGNTILGKEDQLLWGEDSLEEMITDKSYLFSSKSFFQTNIAIAEKICEKVQNLFHGGTLLDLYSGVGLYAVQLGDKAENLTCIEYSEAATLSCKRNLERNNLQLKAQCFAGDVLNFLENYARDKKSFDCIIVNPPRKGLDKRVRELLPILTERDLVYVSCSPVTLARDLKELQHSFDIKEVFPFDMFPHTHHVENVVYLKKNDHPR